MSTEDENKAIVGRWFTNFWGEICNLDIVDELAAHDMLLQYSLHEPRLGREDIKAFMTAFRESFRDLNFWGAADLIAEGDYVVGRWQGGGTHTGPAFNDFLIGSLPAATGRNMHFTGTTVLRLREGKILEEIGLDDGVTELTRSGATAASSRKELFSREDKNGVPTIRSTGKRSFLPRRPRTRFCRDHSRAAKYDATRGISWGKSYSPQIPSSKARDGV
jgi:hypothetical protein